MRVSYTLSKIIFGVALILLAGFSIFTWTGADDHLTAFVKGNYAIAQKQFLEAAERGDATAQYSLALMYDSGKNIPRNDAEAIRWYRAAAEQGHAAAQYNLSMVHFFGKGVPQNYVTAYKWILLADAHEEKHAGNALPKLAEKLSLEQITKAQEAAQVWSKEHSK